MGYGGGASALGVAATTTGLAALGSSVLTWIVTGAILTILTGVAGFRFVSKLNS